MNGRDGSGGHTLTPSGMGVVEGAAGSAGAEVLVGGASLGAARMIWVTLPCGQFNMRTHHG